jgi:hypothetical protein
MGQNPNKANQYRPDPRQSLFLSYYLDPKSKTFSNALQSALKAGYEQEYAESITAKMPTWLSNALEKPISDTRSWETCFICKETRALQKAHLIPKRIVGDKFDSKSNIIILCATHHWCYDHFCLNKKELKKLFSEYEYQICLTLKEVTSEPLSETKLWKRIGKWFYPFRDKIMEVENAG